MRKPQISYKLLRETSAETARLAVLQYYSNSGNVSKTAKLFGITRITVYDILRKSKEGNLKDRPKAPKTVANKTADEVIIKILKLNNRTGYGAKRISKYLFKLYGIKISYSTVRGILARISLLSFWGA